MIVVVIYESLTSYAKKETSGLQRRIAQGKAEPTIVVMPLGYGTMEMVRVVGLS